MTTSGLTAADIAVLTNGRLGIFDVACPHCGPHRRSPANRTRRVLRVWNELPDAFGFSCARCGFSGYTGSRSTVVDLQRRAQLRTAPTDAERRQRARWLASRRLPAAGSVVEVYLREARGYGGPIPETIGYLPPHGDHPPAMIALFGLPDEPEPGKLSFPPDRLTGIHLTKLRPDGSGKAGTDRDKIMVGPSVGTPIVLAPPNDSLGLLITEGIETSLSWFEATGLGVWAAGAAGRMPRLADAVPPWMDTVNIVPEPDDAGRRGAAELYRLLTVRGIHAELRFISENAEGR